MPVFEVVKTVFAPKGNDKKSFAYLPGDPIEFDDSPLGERSSKELLQSGHIGKKGDYARYLKAQQEAEASKLNVIDLRVEIAKLRSEIERLQTENTNLKKSLKAK